MRLDIEEKLDAGVLSIEFVINIYLTQNKLDY